MNLTPEQQEWMDLQMEKHDLRQVIPNKGDTNPCIAVFGPGPESAICKTCIHLFARRMSKTYYKCDMRHVSRGPATDHKVRWPACGKYEEKKPTTNGHE